MTGTFLDLLNARLKATPAQPLITAYDDATGERVELSVMTYANWVSKTANLFSDELMLDPGDTVLIDLPTHWLGPIFLGAAWAAGLVVTTDASARVDAVVCGPDHATYAQRGVPVVSSALLPFGVRFPTPLVAPVVDYGLLWPGQSDVFAPIQAAVADDVAWADGTTQGELLAAASGFTSGDRLITDLNPLADKGIGAFVAPLLAGGSVVLVRHPDEAQWPAHRDDERATVELRDDQPPST